jgi:protein associated with RNAse G/E
MARPGASILTDQAIVVLVPPDQGYVASFYAPGGTAHCSVYVDITTVPVWEAGAVTAVDLDLDVVRGWTGRVWVDDEDEFAAHRKRFGYPSDVVRLAATTCDEVLEAVTAGEPPYDGVASARWLERLEMVMMDS